MVSRRVHVAIFILLALALTLIYWEGRYATTLTAGTEQSYFMRERAHSPSEWDFFVRMLSFNHARKISPGDYALFRPAMTGTNAVLDIFFRDNFFIFGPIAIVLNIICCFILYLLIARLASPILGFFGALALGTHYLGSDIVMNRHICLYIGALLFFLAALLALYKEKQNYWLVGIFIFIAACFNEILLPTLFLAAITALVCVRKYKYKLPKLTKLSVAVFIPLTLYAILSISSFLYYELPGLLSPADPGLSGFRLLSMAQDFLFSLGFLVSHFLVPQLLKLSHEMHTSITNWLGVGSVVFFAYLLSPYSLRLTRSPQRDLILKTMVCYILGILISIVLFRGTQRTQYYIQGQLYYCYFTSGALLVIFACLTDGIWRLIGRNWAKPLCFLVFCAATLNMTVYGSQKLHQHFKRTTGSDVAATHALFDISNYFKQHPEYCLDEYEDPILKKIIEPLFLYRVSCLNRPHSLAMNLSYDKEGRLWLTSGNQTPVYLPNPAFESEMKFKN